MKRLSNMSMEDLESSIAYKTKVLWKCTCLKQWVIITPPWKSEKLGYRQICVGTCKPRKSMV